MKSTQARLAAYPVAEPLDSDFELVSTELPEVGEGQVLLRSIYLSLDPYMRGRMSRLPPCLDCAPTNERTAAIRTKNSRTAPTHSAPRPLFRTHPPGRRQGA